FSVGDSGAGCRRQAGEEQDDGRQDCPSVPSRMPVVSVCMLVHDSFFCYHVSHWYISFHGVISVRTSIPAVLPMSISRLTVRPSGREMGRPSPPVVTEHINRSVARAALFS